MEPSKAIESLVQDEVLVLRINRPEKMNALTMDMYSQLSAGLDQATESREIGAVLIAANGDNFSAGNDMNNFMEMAASLANDANSLSPQDVPVVGFIHRLVRFEKPLFVAVQGQAVGIGLTLTLHADFVYLADTAVLSAPFVDLALVPEAASSMLLPQRIGALRASEILLAAKPVDAKTALDWGLANRVTSPDTLYESALKAAASVAAKPSEALKLTKQLMRGDKDAVSAHVDAELDVFFRRLSSGEAKAAFAAFLAR